MDSLATLVESDVLYQSGYFERSRNVASSNSGLLTSSNPVQARRFNEADISSRPPLISSLTPQANNYWHSGDELQSGVAWMSLADFVRQRFIPEFVDKKKSAGRAHFREILKYILLSEDGDSSPDTSGRRIPKRNAIAGWPYMDSLRLCDISEEIVQHITSTAWASGYSSQTVTHIRNVIRAIYSHANRACRFTGRNPAALVSLPAVVHRDKHVLTLAQLKEVMGLMRYPERAIALFALLTEMDLAEISGLQWQYVNLTGDAQPVREDWIPAKSIAVRNQWYRGEFRPVVGARRKFLPVPELLCSILRGLKCTAHFTKSQDFVLASRTGTPVYPGNIAKRRLKSIGQSCEMPWLSWRVFHRTHARLRSEFGRQLYKEYEKVLPVHMW